MKLTIFVLAAVFCMAHSNPVPLPEESIDLINIPLKDNKELDILTLAESDGTINERNKRTIGILRELFPQLSKVQAVEEQNVLEPSSAGSDAFFETIRVARETTNLNNNQDNKINNDQPAAASEPVKDQQAQAAENSSSAVDELTLDSVEDDENRGKRFLNFGAQASGTGSSGSGGGSGNFLFDIIRLVSGSSGSEQQDERANSPVDGSTDVGKGDGYTEGIPGPVTRLVVLANRGLSNLIQDLILRIAQTSERVVNFKARLITALI
ncbi:unnamed protein product [Chironomus riparius]|uniref:Uncharacterized protein n=1 Tax=Chironomus riparius TaxID=315576 RepID=A0A9N9WRT8_9DIPT|nr:unnamed protein product [Chironomus riparius]